MKNVKEYRIGRHNLDLVKSDRNLIYRQITDLRPQSIYCENIFDQIESSEILIEILGLASKLLFFELSFDQWDHYVSLITTIMDSRVQITKISYLTHFVLKVEDFHVEAKWIQFHDDGNLMRFELINNIVYKYHYWGRHNVLIDKTPYYEGCFIESLSTLPYPSFRADCEQILLNLADNHLIHCELYRHLFYCPVASVKLNVFDWETKYDVALDNYDDFYNNIIRLNSSFGNIKKSEWSLLKILQTDLNDVNRHLLRFKQPLLSPSFLQEYFTKLERFSTEENLNSITQLKVSLCS